MKLEIDHNSSLVFAKVTEITFSFSLVWLKTKLRQSKTSLKWKHLFLYNVSGSIGTILNISAIHLLCCDWEWLKVESFWLRRAFWAFLLHWFICDIHLFGYQSCQSSDQIIYHWMAFVILIISCSFLLLCLPFFCFFLSVCSMMLHFERWCASHWWWRSKEVLKQRNNSISNDSRLIHSRLLHFLCLTKRW